MRIVRDPREHAFARVELRSIIALRDCVIQENWRRLRLFYEEQCLMRFVLTFDPITRRRFITGLYKNLLEYF